MKDWLEEWWWVLILVVLAGAVVTGLIFAIKATDEDNKRWVDCKSAGYATKVLIGDVDVCVGLNIQSGEYVAIPWDIVWARLEGK